MSSAPSKELEDFCSSEGCLALPISLTRAVNPLRDMHATLKLILRLITAKTSLVAAHTPKAGLIGMVSSFVARVPIRVYHIHGLPIETSTGIRAAYLWLAEALACLCATHLYCVSPSVKKRLLRYRLPRAPYATVLAHGTLCGIDLTGRFRYSNDRFAAMRSKSRKSLGISDNAIVMGFVGRFVRDKGISELVTAWEHARKSCPRLRMLMIGGLDDAGGADYCSISRVRTNPEWSWTGWQAAVERYFPAMDFLVLPSYREGFPTVVLEAAALGVPSIVTNATGCIDSVIHGHTGLVVPVRDSAALAQAIVYYYQNAESRCAHGRAARQRVRQFFSRDYVQSQLIAEYERLLASLKKPSNASHNTLQPEAMYALSAKSTNRVA